MTKEAGYSKKNKDFPRFEAIVELLFGDQIRRYDSMIEKMGKQIEKLEKELAENKKDYNNKLQLLSAEIAGNLANLDETISNKIKDSDNKVIDHLDTIEQGKVDKKVLAEKLNLLIEAISK